MARKDRNRNGRSQENLGLTRPNTDALTARRVSRVLFHESILLSPTVSPFVVSSHDDLVFSTTWGPPVP